MPNVPDDAAGFLTIDLKDRFERDLIRAVGDYGAQRLGLAVSGGPDSIALIVLVHAIGVNCAVATVDHGLRPESVAEATAVAQLCSRFAIPHTTLMLDPPDNRSNLMEWARNGRYAALEDWRADHGLSFILTAHHADDQLETMIMRLNRGSGVAGLSGVRRKQGFIARPLLDWSKVELVQVVLGAGLAFVDDPSNRNDRFDRARLRKALDDADWLDARAASRSASALADAEEALDWAARSWFNKRTAERDAILSFDPRSLPTELLRRITLACLRHFEPDAKPRGEELDRLILGLIGGRTATLCGVKCSGGVFWMFSVAPPRRKSAAESP
jgi:tRNA(Ile)-lysidine synthase